MRSKKRKKLTGKKRRRLSKISQGIISTYSIKINAMIEDKTKQNISTCIHVKKNSSTSSKKMSKKQKNPKKTQFHSR